MVFLTEPIETRLLREETQQQQQQAEPSSFHCYGWVEKRFGLFLSPPLCSSVCWCVGYPRHVSFLLNVSFLWRKC
jgi:hypothetical protein